MHEERHYAVGTRKHRAVVVRSFEEKDSSAYLRVFIDPLQKFHCFFFCCTGVLLRGGAPLVGVQVFQEAHVDGSHAVVAREQHAPCDRCFDVHS